MRADVGFTGAVLDRADRERNNPEALAAALGDWRARLLKLNGLEPEVDGEGQLVWASLADLPAGSEPLFLGYIGGKPHFVPLAMGERHGVTRSPALFHMLGLMPGGALCLRAQSGGLASAPRLLSRMRERYGTVPRGLGTSLPLLRCRAFSAHRSGGDHDRGA